MTHNPYIHVLIKFQSNVICFESFTIIVVHIVSTQYYIMCKCYIGYYLYGYYLLSYLFELNSHVLYCNILIYNIKLTSYLPARICQPILCLTTTHTKMYVQQFKIWVVSLILLEGIYLLSNLKLITLSWSYVLSLIIDQFTQ